MKQPQTIPRSGTTDLCSNYEELLRRGTQYCQQLGGDLWTDYNLHDPGVTILQQLCYAITDLSYRTDFRVVDLLEAAPQAPKPEQPLFTGDRILTCNPVTTADYRKFLYDSTKGVKNIWLAPIENHSLGISGLYEVQVETWESVKDENEAAIRKQVEECMRSTRNLAEDVEKVTILKAQEIEVEGIIEIGPQENPVAVLAQVLFDIQNSLIPFPRVQAVDELFKSRQPDEIWNGPLLGLGALDENSLKPLKRTVEGQEIANIMMRTPGVKRVTRLNVRDLSNPNLPPNSPIHIKEGYVPRLSPPILEVQDSYTIAVELEGGVTWHVDSKAVWARIQELEGDIHNSEAYAARSAQASQYLRAPHGEYKNVENYVSIQHQFPVAYGLSKYGIPDYSMEGLALGSKKQREARVQQLKAYLLFFEQLLANYLSQLAHVGNLFSLDEELRKSYFFQRLAHQPSQPSEPQRIADVLIQQSPGTLKSVSIYYVHVVDKKGHVGLISARLATRAQAEELRRRIIESGGNSRNYRIRRINGAEYRLSLHDADGILLASGQELFSTAEAAQASAGRWVGGIVRAVDMLQELVKIHRTEDLSLQVIDESLRIVLTSTGLESKEEREKRIAEIVSCGIDSLNYHSVSVPRGGFRVHLHNLRGELIAEGEETFETEFDAEEGIDRLVWLIERISHSSSLLDAHIRRLPEIEEINKHPLRAYWDSLAALEHQYDNNYPARRNKILNHLLARFGEHFDDDILQQLDLRQYGEKDDFFHELIRWKIEFLRGYVAAPPASGDHEVQNESASARHGRKMGLGSGRGQAFDYSGKEGSNTASGLERRLALLLGIHGHIDGNRYVRTNMDDVATDESSFYYAEKQVSPLDSPRGEDDQGDIYDVPHFQIVSPWRAGEPDLTDLHHNFVFSSQDSGMLRQLLNYGTNRENYRLRTVRNEYHVLFRAPNSDHGLEVHHAIGRQEAEDAISALIRHLQQIKASTAQSYKGERIWVVEHVLLRPRGETERRPVRISHKSGIHLSSPALHKHERDDYLELILLHGRQHDNYRIEVDDFGGFVVVLYHEQKPIAATHALRSQKEAAAAIPKLAGLMHSVSTAKDKKTREAHVHEQAHDTFYSQRISVLLPNWPLRFQSNEFKLYAEQLVQENSPAHLAANCFWLSANDAMEFDRIYRHWKALSAAVHGEKRNQIKALDEASDKIKAFLQRLQAEQERWAASSAGRP